MDISQVITQCINNEAINEKYKINDLPGGRPQARALSKMIGYCSLFKENEGIEEYMNIESQEESIAFLKGKIAQKLGIPSSQIEDNMDEIINYAFENYIRNGYVFHAGNSNSNEYFMRNGLKGTGHTGSQGNELLDINNIFAKYNDSAIHYAPLGAAIADIKKERTGWFFSAHSNNVFYYSTCNPEWFNSFCGADGMYLMHNIRDDYSYERRDYESAQSNLTRLIDDFGMTQEDKETVLSFFNKCWDVYGNSKPSILFIPTNQVKDKEIIDSWKTEYIPSLNNEVNPDRIFEEILAGKCEMMSNDECCLKDVGPEYISCVYIDSLINVNKINNQKEEPLDIADCLSQCKDAKPEIVIEAEKFLENFPVKENERTL